MGKGSPPVGARVERSPRLSRKNIREILVVEDDSTETQTLRSILEEHAFRIVTARGVKEALATIYASRPSLVIGDIKMPGMDGYELCRQIRADSKLADLPVILLPSFSDPEDVLKGLECGVDDFITKPFRENILLARVHHLLANVPARGRELVPGGVEFSMAGHKYNIVSNRTQILNLLVSTYEAAVQKNGELVAARDALAQLRGDLKNQVTENPPSLIEEIGAHKRAFEEMEKQAALLDKTQDAFTVLDLEGKILFWNKGAERLYGWTRPDALGQNIGPLIYADASRFTGIRSLPSNMDEWSDEAMRRTKSGRELTVKTRWKLVRDDAGLPKSMLVVDTDITESKEIEAQFMRAQRMESIGTLARGIAHDLNNVLAPILMSIEILNKTAYRPQARKILQTIEASARRGADIVRQVLALAHGADGERVEVHPQRLLRDIELLVRGSFPRSIHLDIMTHGDSWTIKGDPAQLHQILMNLCVNARDAMTSGGNLTIGTENRLLDEQDAEGQSVARAGPYVVFSVTDSGPGMPPEIVDKIFEPFFTTKEVEMGTGLGLSSVMALVKDHNGFIEVDSRPGKGTTIDVWLPAMSSEEKTVHPMDDHTLPRGNGETILVVDDEASVLSITCQMLEAFGYRALTATNGAEAIASYAQNRDEIAVVLTDTVGINPKIKIMVASGVEKGAGGRTGETGNRHHLLKPYTAGTLLKSLRNLLDQPFKTKV
jgi:PAS domain S-box-containing protein